MNNVLPSRVIDAFLPSDQLSVRRRPRSSNGRSSRSPARRKNRSQIVFTTARGREACFWQSPRTRKQARPNVTTPTARAAGIPGLEIVVDSHERYAYRFATQQVTTV
jgi:hypothetical protein